MKRNVRAGGDRNQHNEALAVRSNVRAGIGGSGDNHNEALAVKSSVRAGGERPQHNETFSAKPAGSLAATLLSCPEAFLVKGCVRGAR